jgi:glycosyltransferase involved in cell wall biosynthesis
MPTTLPKKNQNYSKANPVKMPKVAIIIVSYNAPQLLIPQLDGLDRFCKDDFEVVVVDNSSDKEAANAIKYYCEGRCKHIKTNAGSRGGSSSHSFAANLGYLKFGADYDYLAYLDHDLFPIRDFSVVEILGEKLIAGIGQEKEKTYFWPGCFMFNANEVTDVDFSPSPGLDTGGGTWKLIEKHGKENCIFFGEEYFENDQFQCDNPKYNHYTVIYDTFMHFLGASGWEYKERNEERLNSLLNILHDRINA